MNTLWNPHLMFLLFLLSNSVQLVMGMQCCCLRTKIEETSILQKKNDFPNPGMTNEPMIQSYLENISPETITPKKKLFDKIKKEIMVLILEYLNIRDESDFMTCLLLARDMKDVFILHYFELPAVQRYVPIVFNNEDTIILSVSNDQTLIHNMTNLVHFVLYLMQQSQKFRPLTQNITSLLPSIFINSRCQFDSEYGYRLALQYSFSVFVVNNDTCSTKCCRYEYMFNYCHFQKNNIEHKIEKQMTAYFLSYLPPFFYGYMNDQYVLLRIDQIHAILYFLPTEKRYLYFQDQSGHFLKSKDPEIISLLNPYLYIFGQEIPVIELEEINNLSLTSNNLINEIK